MANFELAVIGLLKREGGLNTNPNDRGGVTKYGISQKSYPNLDIRNLTVENAKAIYYRDFWAPSGLNSVNDQTVAEAVLDTVVASGNSGGGKLVQKALNTFGKGLVVDGKLGSKSISALNTVPPLLFLQALADQRKNLVVSLAQRDPSQEGFLKGWFKRFDSFVTAYVPTSPVGKAGGAMGVFVFGFLLYQVYSQA